MANALAAIKWLNESKRKHNIRVTEFAWPRDYFSDKFFDYRVTLDIDNKTYIGRGQSSDEATAIVKAAAECVERLHCAQNNIHSSGVAAHTNYQNAINNSILELFEHDLVISHLVAGHKPHPLSPPSGFEQVVKTLNKQGLEFEVYPLLGWQGLIGSLVLVLFEEQIISFGLGCAHESQASHEKAFLEALPNAVNFLTKGAIPTNHFSIWRNCPMASSPPQSHSYDLGAFTHSILKCEIKSPFVVVRSLSQALQKFLKSGWDRTDLNFDRLYSYHGFSSSPMYELGVKFF